ncbi:MAG: SsrA-binding protein SmpB [Desulfovibrionaceae bacterium]|nr:SsrA-binding protein SmpB [Desulfovibrionaceae bacterium]
MADHTRHNARIAENRKARQYYEFLEFFEAGLVLTGPEVKSLRAGQVSFGDSFVECRNGEAWLVGMRIAPYERAGYVQQNPDRDRKLLLHAREIRTLAAQTEQKGLTVAPVRLYFKQGRIKMEIALARGRKLHDQREELKRRAESRDVERELARR